MVYIHAISIWFQKKLVISTVVRYGTRVVFSSRHQRHSASGSPASSRTSPRHPACGRRAPTELQFRARICKRLRSLGIVSASLCSLAGRYDNTICRNGPLGYIGWRNRFLEIDSWAPKLFTNSCSDQDKQNGR